MRIVPFVDVFLMHLRRDMNSASSYSSTILETMKSSNLKRNIYIFFPRAIVDMTPLNSATVSPYEVA